MATGKCQALKAIKDKEKIDSLHEGILCWLACHPYPNSRAPYPIGLVYLNGSEVPFGQWKIAIDLI